ncbi:MAG: 2-amino-4-hydroxy-6-hydroxymethyldihydropteridine diphosphokinase [Pseudomonadales bacterium]|nr:2-amino-4-hydroxy-6-hydroxymethyldihydropteridine diphosphokinase [Pseudomonadales bacterium]
MARVYLGLGGNLDAPVHQLRSALEHIRGLPETRLVAVSPFYGSTAVGPGTQPDYVNAACELRTALEPLTLLDQLQAIEQRQGRQRGPEQWAPRTLDLDILLYAGQVIDLPRLTVPHPRLDQRNFVLRPLQDLNPQLCLPDGRRVADLLAQVGDAGLWALAEAGDPA